MGNDGGSFVQRTEAVKLKQDKHSKSLHLPKSAFTKPLWRTCFLTKEPLVEPLASDGYGHLYNFSEIVELLLNKKDFGKLADEVNHITALGDVVKLQVKKNEDVKIGGWVCPVTGREMDDGAKFVYLVPCGHVFSESALKNVKETVCLECGKEYEPENVIPINPPDTDLAKLQARLDSLKGKGLRHSLAKIKKDKKRKPEGEDVKPEKKRRNSNMRDTLVSDTVKLVQQITSHSSERSAAVASLFHSGDTGKNRWNDSFGVPSKLH
jgi:replication termination factor 2